MLCFAVSDEQTWLADGEINDLPPTCDGCKLQFESITDLLDHVNQDCINGRNLLHQSI